LQQIRILCGTLLAAAAARDDDDASSQYHLPFVYVRSGGGASADLEGVSVDDGGGGTGGPRGIKEGRTMQCDVCMHACIIIIRMGYRVCAVLTVH